MSTERCIQECSWQLYTEKLNISTTQMPTHSRTDRLWYTRLTEYDSYETEHIAGNHEDEFPRHNDNQLEPDTADYRLYDPIYKKGEEQTKLICGDRSQHGGDVRVWTGASAWFRWRLHTWAHTNVKIHWAGHLRSGHFTCYICNTSFKKHDHYM